MNVLSLFSGIGGFDLGLEQAGFHISAMCEIDKRAQKILLRNFSNAELYDDVRDLNFSKGDFDVICGGFPCQDVSKSGKRAGLAGERSGLWHEFKRVIDDVEPKWVIVENVPGLLSSAGGRDFATIIQWLAERGYGVGWRVLDSSRFGLAQRRKRVFIVASFGNRNGCELLFKHKGVEGTYRTSRKKEETHTGVNSEENTVNAKSVDSVLWEMSHADTPVRICKTQDLSPTLLARMGTGGNGIPLIGLRRLTPTEFERLQGFPDGWTLGNSNLERYKQLGNAVSVPVVKWIGTQIIKIEKEDSYE